MTRDSLEEAASDLEDSGVDMSDALFGYAIGLCAGMLAGWILFRPGKGEA